MLTYHLILRSVIDSVVAETDSSPGTLQGKEKSRAKRSRKGAYLEEGALPEPHTRTIKIDFFYF